MTAHVVSVHRSGGHTMAKGVRSSVRLLAGLGVDGDAHAGVTVQHLSRVRRDPTQPNLRQVHLVGAELHDELAARGFRVAPGSMGENVVTREIDLLALPTGAVLRLGEAAQIELTGLRNPCGQLNGVADGLMAAVLDRSSNGELVRRAGVMAVVLTEGEVRPGDAITVTLPAGEHVALGPV